MKKGLNHLNKIGNKLDLEQRLIFQLEADLGSGHR